MSESVYKQLLPQDLQVFLQEHPESVLLDVRESWEYALVSLPGAVPCPLGAVRDAAEDLIPDKDTPVVACCHHGIRSAGACMILFRLGYTNLYNLSGGIDRYSQLVDPGLGRY